jgi:hypothetical protein
MSYPPSKFNLGDIVRSTNLNGFALVDSEGPKEGRVIGKSYCPHGGGHWFYIIDIQIGLVGAFNMLDNCISGSKSFIDPLGPNKPDSFTQSREGHLEFVSCGSENIRDNQFNNEHEEDHGGLHLI